MEYNFICDNKQEYKLLSSVYHNIKEIKKEWRSRYSSYVVCDYEPFCPDGFEILVTVIGKKEDVLFTEYLYSKMLITLNDLKFLQGVS